VSYQLKELEDRAYRTEPVAPPRHVEEYDNISAQLNDDESMADDMTVASTSFMGDDDRYDMSQQSTGHRKRKREDIIQNAVDQAHVVWADELLDYFMISHDTDVPKPEPPPNFQADWVIDTDGHTGMHWAAAMGDVEVMKQLKRFGGNLAAENVRGESPLMRAVMFTNCMDKQTMPTIVNQLIQTIEKVDHCNSTAIHHAAAITSSRNKHQCSRYYLDVILNKMQEVFEPEQISRLIDAQDINGNTAIHLAAQNKARKCVRALIGRGASTDIINNENQTAEDIIQELNANRNRDRHHQSSSPFAPESARKSVYDAFPEENTRAMPTHHSEAALSIESKITPLMLEKFRELAASFDDELIDKDESEKEAKRLLDTTHVELAQIREQLIEVGYSEHKDVGNTDQEKAQYSQLDTAVVSLIEQQQQMQLFARAQHEESKQNGHISQGDDDLAERAALARMLSEEQNKRQKLVGEYKDALSMAGAGEKGEQYRRLISKCIDHDVETMDENIDSLLEQILDDQGGLQNEIHAAESL
jgi:transcription factor MBP1